MRFRRCTDAGSAIPLVVITLFVLFSVLAFCVDQGIAYAAKARQENVLDAMRTACMEPSVALTAKSSENPGEVLASRVVEAARAEGFEGQVSLWFYEVPAAQLTPAHRLWEVGLQVDQDVPTVLARGFGIASLPAASHRTMVVEPYAGERVWRPSWVPIGKYIAQAGQSQKMFYGMGSIEEFPDEMVQEISAVLNGGDGRAV